MEKTMLNFCFLSAIQSFIILFSKEKTITNKYNEKKNNANMTLRNNPAYYVL